MVKIALPEGAATILDTLQAQGFDAYVVGGCVRDSLIGKAPKDWDICTSAHPDQVEEIFAEYRIFKTGIKHGTVTILMDDGQYEVTTFRTDGSYSDFRRPDDVHFVSNVKDDLSRRDFTMNALAYNRSGLLDFYNGRIDIQSRVISCVGNADDRFKEDALRMMRALRFASVYGFSIEEETASAIHRNKELLVHIAAERINTELCKLLLGNHILPVLLEYSDVLAVIIPEFRPCIGFDQNNKYHQYTVYDHMMYAVSYCKSDDLSVRLALFLHDIGKPFCYSEDENGGHFHGHAVPSHDIAKEVLERLKFDTKTKNEVLELILFHDSVIEPNSKTVRRWLNKIGEERFRQLLFVREADILAHAKGTQESRLERCHALYPILEDILKGERCFKLKDMHINGNDILALGVPEGKQVGIILKSLLDLVISGDLENDHEILLHEATKNVALPLPEIRELCYTIK